MYIIYLRLDHFYVFISAAKRLQLQNHDFKQKIT